VGLRPRRTLVVTGRDPTQSAFVVQVQGQQAILGHALADKIWVAAQDETTMAGLPRQEAAPHTAAATEQRDQVGAARPARHEAQMERAS
jgi:hypothetical protein